MALVVLIPLARLEGVVATSVEQPELVRVGSVADARRQSADVSFALNRSAKIMANVSGTLSSLAIRVGEPIAPGALLASIDGRPIRAFRETTPLYRDLRIGDRGDDVEALTAYLATAGHLTKAQIGPIFGVETQKAVTAYQKSIGEIADGVFKSESVAYVSPDFASVSKVAVAVGDVVAGPWNLAEGAPRPREMSFSAAGGARLVGLDSGPFLLSSGSKETKISQLTSTSTDLDGVFDFLAAAEEAGAVSSTESGEPESKTTTFSGAFISLADPPRSGIVPSTALFVSQKGKSCLFEDDGHGAAPSSGIRAILVKDAQPSRDTIGQILVSADFAKKRVVRAPSTLPENLLQLCR